MKPKSTLRSFLLVAGSSLLAISYSHGQTILADSYLTSLSVASPTTVYSSLNFPSYLEGPLTGSSTLTTTGYFNSLLYFTNNGASNTFSGNITVDSGTLRLAGSPFATTSGGFTAPSMTSSNTITINRAGTLFIDDTVTGGYTANRFGTASRPAVNLAGGTISLNGLNNATSSVQTFGALTSSSGQGTVNVTRNTSGNPTLNFSSLAINSGSLLTFNGTALGTGTNDARITFASGPTLTNGIIAGARFFTGAAGTSDLATYGANGVTAYTTYDLSSNNINGATSTQNVQIPTATTAATLTGDVSVNSLNFAGNAGWSLGGFKLTIVSGMLLRNGSNADPGITTGTLTAGNGTDNIDLNIIVAQNNMTNGAVIADNASSKVTLVKSGDARTLTLNGGANNTYTGGTYVVGGTLATGNVADRTYLGTGKVTVDNATLTLGNIGATSNATGDDYTAINGGLITLATGASGAYTANDTFNIGANSIIQGASTTNQSLNSLTRGTNVTLASGAIIAHSTALTGALNLTTGTIKSLGTSADLFYGLTADQNNTGGSIDIGSGTAFRGISTDRTARNWLLGTINIASGTTSVDFQGFAAPTANLVLLTLGNGVTANAPDINFAGSGTVDINAIGLLTLNDDAATYGDTGASQNVRFVSKAGSTLTVTAATGMGSGTGIASALVNNGGILAIGNTAALNGAVTVEAGGQFNANQAAGLTGSGALSFNAGSIINITSQAAGFSGAQATAATIAAGTIVRLGLDVGTAADPLDNYLGTKSPIYQLFSGNRTMANPTSAGTTIMTLNKNGSGVGGILTNDTASRNLLNSTNGVVTLGANGGVVAATTNTTLTVAEEITGAGSLTIGSTSIIDGAPKAGTVTLSNTNNSYLGGTIVNPGSLTYASDNILGNAAGSITLNGGTIKPGSTMTTSRELILNNVAGNVVQVQGNQTWTHTGNITGDGGVTFRQNPNGGVTADLQGTANTFKGALGIEFGNSGIIVKLRSLTDSVTANGNIIYGIGSSANTGGSGQIFEWDSTAASALTLDNRSIEFGQNGAAWGTIKNSNTSNAITINKDLVVSGTGTKTLVLESVAGPSNNFAGKIIDGSGTVSLRKEGAGIWVLSGANTYTGSTLISTGILQLGNGGTTGSLTGTSSITNSANLTINRSNAFTQATDLGGQIITGAGSLTLAGSGTTTLSLANNYTGATTINAGTLLVNGSTSASSAVAVNNTSTLGGTGTIGGTVTVAATANVAPGASAGTLAITGGLNISAPVNGGAGKLKFELGSIAASDKITVGGTLTIGTALLDFSDFTFSTLPGLQDGTYTLMTYGTLSGTIAASGLTGPIGAGTGTLSINTTTKTVELLVSGVGAGGSAYATWKATNAPTGNPDADYDGDGVSNAVEFVLGGLASTNDLSKLPTVSTSGGNLLFTFKRAQSSIDPKTSLSIEVGTDLVTWTTPPSPYTVSDNATGVVNPGVTVEKGVPANFDTVTLSVAQDSAKKFARLKVVITP